MYESYYNLNICAHTCIQILYYDVGATTMTIILLWSEGGGGAIMNNAMAIAVGALILSARQLSDRVLLKDVVTLLSTG